MKRKIRLTELAKELGVSRVTAYNWFKKGYIKNAKQMPSGLILITLNDGETVEDLISYNKRSDDE